MAETTRSTVKRQLTPREIAARRRNAQRSTGPRTRAGKRRSALNSLKWPICSRRRQNKLAARGEDPREFRRFARDLTALLRPPDPPLRRLVASLAVGWWRKVRLLRRTQPSSVSQSRFEARILRLDGRIEDTLWLFARALRLRTRKWYRRLASGFGTYLYSPEVLRREIEARLEPLRALREGRAEMGLQEKFPKLLRTLVIREKPRIKTNPKLISPVISIG
jgi:hypothetical protein